MILLAVLCASSYKGGMDRELLQPDSVDTSVGERRAPSDDLLVMLGKVLRAISDILASIDDRQRGSLVARRLMSIVFFFIRALLCALRANHGVCHLPTPGTTVFDRALVAPPSRWAAP